MALAAAALRAVWAATARAAARAAVTAAAAAPTCTAPATDWVPATTLATAIAGASKQRVHTALYSAAAADAVRNYLGTSGGFGSSSSSSGGRGGSSGRSRSSSSRVDPPLLTAWIKRAASPDELLAIEQQHSSDLNPIHVSAIFTQLKHLSQKQQGLVKQLAAQELLQAMQQLLEKEAFVAKCGARELANIIHASAYLSWLPAVHLLLPAFFAKRAEADLQHLANTVWAVATMEQQIPQQQLHQLLEALVRKVAKANPQDVSNTIWAVATMGQHIPQQQLQQLLAALVRKIDEANPQAVANTLWAVATMGQHIPQQQLRQLLAALVSMVEDLKPQGLSNTVWACAKLRYTPLDLFAVLDSEQQVLQKLLPAMKPQGLSNTALACAHLGYSSTSLPSVVLQRAVELLQCPEQQYGFNTQDLSNLAWSAAVLDLQQQSPAVLQLVKAWSRQWGNMAAEDLQQLYQVHLWLLDCQLPAAGPKGLSGCLTARQLQNCRHSWEQLLKREVSAETASPLQRKVFKAICQLLADSTWQQPPAMEQRTADGAFSIDIAAVTSAGVRLAIEVEGPSHFLLEPFRAVDGPTAFRNRALAARGYEVATIPFFEWEELNTVEQRLQYLASKLGVAAAAG